MISQKHIEDKLVCNKCYSELVIQGDNIECSNCKSVFTNDRAYVFNSLEGGDIEDSLDKIKYILKRFSKLYQILIDIISPVYTYKLKRDINRFIRKHKGKTIINLGSGNTRLSSHVINVDIFNYDNVDVVSDISRLPFKDNSIDAILNIAVLEHVKNSEEVVDEIYRVLKPGGEVYSYFPFIQGFHASPYDYTRRTFEGLKELYSKFTQLSLKTTVGGASGFLWVMQEFLAILFSFGIKPLHKILLLLLMITTFPIKYLDAFMAYIPMSGNIASGFSYIGKK